MNYRSLSECADLVTEKTGLSPSDLEGLLEVSAGIDPTPATPEEAEVYRPYFVASQLLQTRKTQLVSADGATFVNPLEVSARYMALQAALDAKFRLVIPPGMEAVTPGLPFNIGLVRV